MSMHTNRATIGTVLMAAALAGLAACGPAAPSGDAAAVKAGGAKLYGDAQRGRDFVSRSCTTCHTLGDAGTDGAPPLPLLKKDPQKTGAYIRGFLRAPHQPMPPLALTNQDVEDIVAYLFLPD